MPKYVVTYKIVAIQNVQALHPTEAKNHITRQHPNAHILSVEDHETYYTRVAEADLRREQMAKAMADPYVFSVQELVQKWRDEDADEELDTL